MTGLFSRYLSLHAIKNGQYMQLGLRLQETTKNAGRYVFSRHFLSIFFACYMTYDEHFKEHKLGHYNLLYFIL